jgi:hypothetical protein
VPRAPNALTSTTELLLTALIQYIKKAYLFCYVLISGVQIPRYHGFLFYICILGMELLLLHNIAMALASCMAWLEGGRHGWMDLAFASACVYHQKDISTGASR